MLSAKTDHLVAGAVARGVMISSLYPVDTVKTRVQMFGAAEGLKVGDVCFREEGGGGGGML